MRYTIGDLNIFATPKADMLYSFKGFAKAQFNFPDTVRTVLFIQSGQVRANRQGGRDYYEIVGRLYTSENPRQTGENHIGKLYVHVYNHPHDTEFKTTTEKLEWHPDGSFDIISENGERFHTKSQQP